MNGDSVTSKDVSNWQATQNQAFKVHFSPGGNLKRNIACKGIKRHLKAIAKGRAQGSFSSCRKAQGCGGEDSMDGGHGHFLISLLCCFQSAKQRFMIRLALSSIASLIPHRSTLRC